MQLIHPLPSRTTPSSCASLAALDGRSEARTWETQPGTHPVEKAELNQSSAPMCLATPR